MGWNRKKQMMNLSFMTLTLLVCAVYGMLHGTRTAETMVSKEAEPLNDTAGWTPILLETGSMSDGRVVIRRGGDYRITGTLEEGQIYVDADDSEEVVLCLAGVRITNSSDAAIYIKNAGKTTILLEEGSENVLQSGDAADLAALDTEEEPESRKAAVYARDDLSITGTGTLEVYGYIYNGIHTTNLLSVDSGEIRVEAANVGMKGKDAVTITGGDLVIISGGDGIKSNDITGEDYGTVHISGGTFLIESGGDGIQAETVLDITGGDFTITSGGGSEAAPDPADRNEEGFFGGPGGGGRESAPQRREGETDLPSMPAKEEQRMGARPSGSNEGTEVPFPDRQDFSAPPDDREEQQSASQSEERGHRDGMPGGRQEMPEFDMEERNQERGDTEESEEDTDPSCKGLKSGVRMEISGGSFSIDSCDDAFHSDGSILISDGVLLITSGDDGIHADTELTVTGGTVEVGSCYEGLEANQVLIEDGKIQITSADDGINANGGMDRGWPGRGMGDAEDIEETEEEMPNLCISGGTVLVDAGGDGLDSNGNLIIQGGTVIVDGPSDNGNGALDSGSESGGCCRVNGGLVLAIGNAGMAESFDSDSEQCSLSCRLSDGFQEGSVITITNMEGQVLYTHTALKSGNSVIFSSPELEKGETVFLDVDGETQESLRI